MNTETDSPVEHLCDHNSLDLFEELSFPERIRKVIRGLKAPDYTGDYKYARLQLLRLWSPVSAVVVPVLIMLLVLWAAAIQPRVTYLPSFKYMPNNPPLKPLKDVRPIEPPDPPKVNQDVEKLLKNVPFTGPVTSKPFSPVPAPHNAVKLNKSPVIFKDIFGADITGTIGDLKDINTIDDTTEQAVLQALRWLKHVQESDGSWVQESGGGEGRGTPPAMTGLAIITFLSHGETPLSEEFGPTVERGIRWLVENQESDGRFTGRDKHDYSHPIATYALCEAYCLTKIPMVKDAAAKAIDIILRGQHTNGAWDYNCKISNRHDLSYTGWCVQALKAAQFAKLENDGLDKAVRSAVRGLTDNAHPAGGFGYTGPQQSHLTGVGVLCMQLLGAANEAASRNGLTWLERATLDWDQPWGKSPIYYWYYVTQAKFHASKAVFDPWNSMMRTELPHNQVVLAGANEDGKDMGYWEAASKSEHCRSRVYNTTLCALSLQVAYRYLALFREPVELPAELADQHPQDVPIAVL